MNQQPEPLPPVDLRKRVLRIFWLATRIFLSYFFYSIFSIIRSQEKNRRLKGQLHRKNALRLKATTLSLKGLLIKVGQFMSARVDIMPEAYIEVLSQLQDQVPPAPFSEIKARTITELGAPPETIFESFNEIPIASASLGQVHEAWLKDTQDQSENQDKTSEKEESPGRRVAVKIQYPGIERIVQTDLKAIKTIAWFLQQRFSNIRFDILYEEFSRIVQHELNYITEGRQAELFERNFRDDDRIVVPKVIWKYTTTRLLTLEYIEGIKINQLDQIRAAGIDQTQVATLLVESYMKQILQHRFFHGDPHPGNIFVQPGPRLAYVDFGLMQAIHPAMHRGIKKMILAIIDRDISSITQALLDLGFIARTDKIDDIEKAVYFFMDRYRDLSPRVFKQITLSQIADDFGILFKIYPALQIPNHFILVGRTTGLLNGLCAHLAPDLNIIELAKPHAKRFVLPDDWVTEFLSKGKEILSALIELPVTTNKLIKYANSGLFETEMHSDDLTGILTKIYNLAYRSFLLIVIAGGAFLYHNTVQNILSPEGFLIAPLILIPSLTLVYSLLRWK